MGTSSDFGISEDHCDFVEELTSEQANSFHWFHYRQGGVTASIFREVVKTSLTKPSKSLIQRICYPSKIKLNTAAIKHGCQHEKDAVNSFREIASRQHQDLRVFKSGLVLKFRISTAECFTRCFS
ncbi:hypothetical protein Zmor_006104 [Zophobas morio]|uniref:YqaJ viral recombinase domain-containing protein n=1 Tax=Zophobas morio TaxID=2755281 RepID=A0AA38MN97_9CUCU|nr:hypothetical protein Zmor_006104 [Zophobas morio]